MYARMNGLIESRGDNCVYYRKLLQYTPIVNIRQQSNFQSCAFSPVSLHENTCTSTVL